MSSFSGLGIGLSFLFACVLLAFVAELYYLLWWKKKMQDIENQNLSPSSSSSNYTPTHLSSCLSFTSKSIHPQPAILPISNQQTLSAGESQAPVSTPAFRAFINNITETVRSGLSSRRPWTELVDRSAFSKPDSITDAAGRIRKNYSYFRVNYLTIVAAVLGFSLLTNPFSLLILVGLLAAWLFLYLFRPSDPPLVIFGRTFSERETLGLLIVSSIVVIFLTSVGSVLISALLLGTAVVSAHGAFRTPEDLFLDEQEPSASTGFLSFLGGAATNAAVSAAPVVAAARV